MINVLFYTSTFRNFRNVLLGHLLDLQSHPKIQIVLLIEKFDNDFTNLLSSKHLFPNIVSIIEVNQYNPESDSLFKEYKRLFKLLANLFKTNKFDFVVGTSDFHSVFELLLFRIAKKNKSYTITISATISGNMKNIAKWIDLVNLAQISTKNPKKLKYIFIYCRKFIGHFFYYFVLPISNFHLPFWGKSSFVLNKGQSGMRDAETHLVFSHREKEIFMQNGVNHSKLLVLPPDFSGNFNEFNEKYLFTNNIVSFDFLILLPALDIGFRKDDYSLIDANERLNERLKVIELIIDNFPNSTILIKPHPLIESDEKIKEIYSSKFFNIQFAQPGIHVDEYINRAKIIIDLPMSQSSTLFLGKFQFPNKTFISLNLHDEFEGDYYKNNSHEILYIDNLDIFKNWLSDLVLDDIYYNKVSLLNTSNLNISLSNFMLNMV